MVEKGKQEKPFLGQHGYGQSGNQEKSLTIEVNSQKRADKARQLVKKHLKDMAVYKTAVIQSAESALKELQKTPSLEKI